MNVVDDRLINDDQMKERCPHDYWKKRKRASFCCCWRDSKRTAGRDRAIDGQIERQTLRSQLMKERERGREESVRPCCCSCIKPILRRIRKMKGFRGEEMNCHIIRNHQTQNGDGSTN